MGEMFFRVSKLDSCFKQVGFGLNQPDLAYWLQVVAVVLFAKGVAQLMLIAGAFRGVA